MMSKLMINTGYSCDRCTGKIIEKFKLLSSMQEIFLGIECVTLCNKVKQSVDNDSEYSRMVWKK